MRLKLTFIQKSVYGKTLFYPIDDCSKGICIVAGQKSLSHKDLESLNKSGFDISVKTEDVELFKKNAEGIAKTSEA